MTEIKVTLFEELPPDSNTYSTGMFPINALEATTVDSEIHAIKSLQSEVYLVNAYTAQFIYPW